jgi:hypothetical protein
MEHDPDALAPAPPPKRVPATWRGRDRSDIWIMLVIPVALMWFLCLTSPASDLGPGQGAVAASLFSAVWLPLMWIRLRP